MRCYLIQRLQKPFPKDSNCLLAKDPNAFSFGGGLKNGGLSNEAMALIKDIFRFDYMGAAEFEFGAVPKALQAIAKQKNVSFSFEVKTKAKKTGDVFVICRDGDQEEVRGVVTEFAYDPYGKKAPITKEFVGIDREINGEKYSRCCGWLDVDNAFFFFTDREMFQKTAKLFGVNVESESNDSVKAEIDISKMTNKEAAEKLGVSTRQIAKMRKKQRAA